MSDHPASGAVGVQVVLLAAVAAATVLVVAAAAGSVLVAAGRAQDAADAAALAAARASVEAGGPHAAAASAARTHGATLVACACSGPRVRVVVAVPVAAPAARALGITEQGASAEAGLLEVGAGRDSCPRRSSGLVAVRYRRSRSIHGAAMGSTRPVRVDSEIVAAAEQTARQQHRSTAEQVNRWARLGKHLDLSLSVDQRRIEGFFAGAVQFKDLTDEERAVAHAGLDADMEERAREASFGEDALQEGITVVALDDQGRIVETSPDGSSRTL